MTLQTISELLKATGLPVAYRAFKERQDPPFICYLVVNSNNFFADDSVYFPVNRLQIELYTSDKDPETEKKLEMALQGLCWEKSESLIESEQIYQITYEIEV